MLFIAFIGFLTFFVTLFYIPYFFIARIRNKEKVFPKKKFFIVLISGFLLFVVAFSIDDVFKVSEVREENRELTKDVNQLSAETDKLNDDLSKLEKEIESMTEEDASLQEDLEKLSKENKELKVEIEELTKENKELKSKNKELTKEIEKQKKAIIDLENENKKLKEKATSSNSVNTEKTVETKTSNSNKQANNDTNEGDCNIKGSKSGIYHVPGSTYYSRTTNVVEWFCSEEEAKNAGYRAPKR